jgi:hypothetical protein
MDLSLYLGILKEGLKLWNAKEGQKYLDRVVKLEKDYYEELSKPEDERSQLYLDNCLLELRIISQSFLKHPVKK